MLGCLIWFVISSKNILLLILHSKCTSISKIFRAFLLFLSFRFAMTVSQLRSFSSAAFPVIPPTLRKPHPSQLSPIRRMAACRRLVASPTSRQSLKPGKLPRNPLTKTPSFSTLPRFSATFVTCQWTLPIHSRLPY